MKEKKWYRQLVVMVALLFLYVFYKQFGIMLITN